MIPTKDNPESILIVDDTPANVEVMSAYLTMSGFQVLAARNGETGLRIARREQPDLILLDVLLPGMDGFEVCRRLKADRQTREIPVIFMTVVTRTEDKVTGFVAGGVDYITKPFQREEVLARVETHLTLHRLQQDLRELNRTLEDNVAERTAELAKANRAYRALSECNQALLRAAGEPELLRDICRIISQECSYGLVWIGLADQDEAHTVRPVAQAGYEHGYLETIRITWADTDRGRGPTGVAIRTGTPVVNRDVLTNPDYRPWQEEALKCGYASSAAIPLATGGRVLGALNVYAAEPDTFTPEELTLLEEIAQDLAYGIDALRMRVTRHQAEDALRESEARYRRLFEDSPLPLWEEDFSRVKEYFETLRAAGVRNFRTYLEQHPEAVAHCAGLVKVLDVNQATLTLVGATEKQAVLVGLLPEGFTKTSFKAFAEELSTLAEGGRSFESEAVYRAFTGEEQFIALRLSVAPGYERSLGKVLVSMLDITHRKKNGRRPRTARGRTDRRTASVVKRLTTSPETARRSRENGRHWHAGRRRRA